MVEAFSEADGLERGDGASMSLLRPDASVGERQLHICERRCSRNEVVGLEDKADLPTAYPGERRLIEVRTSTPSSMNHPLEGTSRHPRMFIIVDLPEPDAPMMATKSPRSIVSETPLNARTSASPIA